MTTYLEPARIGYTDKSAGARRLLLGLAVAVSSASAHATPLNLLGFVTGFCANHPRCFEITVEDRFVAKAGRKLVVHYDGQALIRDPEGYELTLEQTDIVLGAHLRLTISKHPDGNISGFLASGIWIGD